MADAPAKPTRSRRGARNDEDEENEVPVAPVAATAAAAPEAAAPPAPVSRRGAPRATQFSSEAIAAAGAAPVAPPASAVAPPPSAAAAPASAAGAGRHADPSVSAAAGAGAAAGGVHSAKDLYEVDYDSVTFAELTGKYLKLFTRQQVENAMIAHLQSEEVEEEENRRVEKFLDVSAAALTSSSAGSAPAAGDDGADNEDHQQGYTYSEMLTRLYEQLNRNHEGSALMERNQVPVPVLEKIGKKKTVISNFGRICDVIRRPVEDVKDFIEKELAIRGNLDSNNALILKYQTNKATDFDRIFIKYLDEYVKCNSCHRIDTTLSKDGRRLELRCNWCTATRTVQTAGSATFSAQIEKRSRTRAAAALTL